MRISGTTEIYTHLETSDLEAKLYLKHHPRNIKKMKPEAILRKIVSDTHGP